MFPNMFTVYNIIQIIISKIFVNTCLKAFMMTLFASETPEYLHAVRQINCGGSKDVQDTAATAEEDDAEATVKHGEEKRVR